MSGAVDERAVVGTALAAVLPPGARGIADIVTAAGQRTAVVQCPDDLARKAGEVIKEHREIEKAAVYIKKMDNIGGVAAELLDEPRGGGVGELIAKTCQPRSGGGNGLTGRTADGDAVDADGAVGGKRQTCRRTGYHCLTALPSDGARQRQHDAVTPRTDVKYLHSTIASSR